MPSAGKITNFITPGGFGVRMDTACYSGYTIPPYYDSMIAKLIVHGESREEVVQISKRALLEFIIGGIDTTIPFHLNLLKNDDFINNNYNTNFLALNDIML